MQSVVTTGDTIESAISEGLKQLKARPNEVMVEVLEEPNHGYSGESNPARVRLIRMTSEPQNPSKLYKSSFADTPTNSYAPQRRSPLRNDDRPTDDDSNRRSSQSDDRRNRSGQSSTSEDRDRNQRSNKGRGDNTSRDSDSGNSRSRRGNRNRRGGNRRDAEGNNENYIPRDHFSEEASDNAIAETELPAIIIEARDILSTILQHMGYDEMSVEVLPSPSHDDDDDDDNETTGDRPTEYYIFNIYGPRIYKLIGGRQGEVIYALQYLLRMIMNRRQQERISISVDAGQYKMRHRTRLYELAETMAQRAIEQEETVALEPMSSNDRRIIHMSLMNREGVETRSVGDGNNRKVTIVPLSQQ